MIWCLILCGLIALGVLFFVWQDNSVVLTRLTAQFPTLPRGFDGFRIVHISDLHNKRFGKHQRRLMKAVRRAEPEVILITGDLIDKRRTRADGLSPALEFVEEAVKTAPTYYITGNHEAFTPVYKTLKPELLKRGVTILDDASALFSRNGEQIALLGLAGVAPERTGDSPSQVLNERGAVLARLQKEHAGRFQILLSHRPDWAAFYEKSGVPLTLSGHAHGGQVRLPFVGPLYAPHQGIFPKYTAGLYRWPGGGMCVSRGLGNSRFPFRVFDRPQVIALTLKTDG